MTSRQKLLFMGFQCIIIALLLESSLRLLRPARMVGISHFPLIYTSDTQNGYRYKPNSQGWYHRYFEVDNIVQINSAGFHDVDHSGTDPGLRIIASGDSFTAANEVPVAKSWTQVLQKKLRDAGHGIVHVINLGMDGTGTDVHRDILERYLRCAHADIVLLAFYENDIADMGVKQFSCDMHERHILFWQDEGQRRRIVEYYKEKQFSSPVRWLYNSSYVARALINRTGRSRLLRKNVLTPQTAGIEVRKYGKDKWANRIEHAFLDLIHMSRQHGFALLVVPIPGKEEPLGSMNALLENISREIHEELHIIDVVPDMHALSRAQDLNHVELYWKYDHHFNAAGHRVFGIALAKALHEGHWLSSRIVSPDPGLNGLGREVSSVTDGGTKPP